MTSNVILQKDGVQLTIDTYGEPEHNLVKKLTSITTPTQKQNWGSGPQDTKILDLLIIEERFNFDGYISQGAYSGDTHSDIADRKDDLVNMFKAGGVITVQWDGKTFTANMEKLNVRKVIDDDNPDKYDGEVGYIVKFTLIKGVDM